MQTNTQNAQFAYKAPASQYAVPAQAIALPIRDYLEECTGEEPDDLYLVPQSFYTALVWTSPKTGSPIRFSQSHKLIWSILKTECDLVEKYGGATDITQEAIAYGANTSVSSVKRFTAKLEAHGVLKVTAVCKGGFRYHNQYSIISPLLWLQPNGLYAHYNVRGGDVYVTEQSKGEAVDT